LKGLARANDDVVVAPASVAALASPTPQDEYHKTAMSPADEDALLAKALHEQELAALAADAAAAAEAESAAVAMALHEEEMAAASAAAELRDREAQARRAAEEAASEALVRELQQYESCGEQAGGSAALLSRLQAESDAEVARQMQDEEDQQLPPPAFRSLGAATPWGREAREGARAEARAEAATISRHLFQPSARLSGIAEGGGGCSTPCGACAANSAAGVAGGSYASVASEWPRTVHASSPAPPISLPLPSSHAAGARVSRRLQLVVDGANVGWAFGSANGWSAFCAQGVLHCVEYWRGKGVRPEAIAVVLHSKYYYAAPHDEEALGRLEAMGVLNWSPEGHDDDLFMLQLAADADAWLVSNDTYSNHSSVRARLRNRLIPYMWAGFGKDKTAFTPKADKWAAFEQDRAHRSN